MKSIRVHFTGAARAISGEKQITLELEDTASYQDVVQELAVRYPGLVGVLIAPDQRSFLSANFFNRNGEEAILPEMMTEKPRDGELLIILYFIVGG